MQHRRLSRSAKDRSLRNVEPMVGKMMECMRVPGSAERGTQCSSWSVTGKKYHHYKLARENDQKFLHAKKEIADLKSRKRKKADGS